MKSDNNFESISLSEKIVTIRAENSNTTYYVLIYPNNQFLSTNLSIEGNQIEDQNSIDSDCMFHGLIVSPIRGKAAITVCANNNKMVSNHSIKSFEKTFQFHFLTFTLEKFFKFFYFTKFLFQYLRQNKELLKIFCIQESRIHLNACFKTYDFKFFVYICYAMISKE